MAEGADVPRPVVDGLTRRRFLGGAVAGGAALFLGACAAGRSLPPEASTPSGRIGLPGVGSLAAGAVRTVGSARSVDPARPSSSIAASPARATDAVHIAGADVAVAAATPSQPTLRARIGQMLLVGFRGRTADAHSQVMIDVRDHGLGGVLLYDFAPVTIGNIGSPAQLKALVATLRAAAAIPLMVATDQEGGEVARLGPDHGFPATVSAQSLGQRNDVAYTKARAHAMAVTLHSMGINQDLAPVVDLNRNPNNPIIGALHRSFSANPTIVTNQALAFIDGMHLVGVRCTLKHFPGHGSSTTDSHLGVVDVTGTWAPVELQPFQRIVAAGRADAIMTAHIFNARLDPNYPATLSKPTITGILRDQIGFGGVVISDDMQMGAIRKEYGFSTAVLRAIDAGVDILTISNDTPYVPGIVGSTIDMIEGFVTSGRLTEARIDASWARIRRLKGV